MNVSSLINPLNMPQNAPAAATPSYNPYIQSSDPAPQPTVNPYNDHVDGFLTRTIFGGISGKNMGKIVFEKGAGAQGGLDAITKNVFVKQTAMSAGVGAGLYAGLSVIKQGIGMARGQQDARGAAANILTDALRGGASGIGASAGGGLTALAMRAMGATGTIGTIVTFVGGAIGGSIGGELVEATGVRNKLVSAFGSQKIAA